MFVNKLSVIFCVALVILAMTKAEENVEGPSYPVPHDEAVEVLDKALKKYASEGGRSLTFNDHDVIHNAVKTPSNGFIYRIDADLRDSNDDKKRYIVSTYIKDDEVITVSIENRPDEH